MTHEPEPNGGTETDRTKSEASSKLASCLLAMRAEELIHVGIGQVNGAIDLPVAREQTTGWPNIPSSGLKGALRDFMRQAEGQSGDVDTSLVKALFGWESGSGTSGAGQADGSAGALSFGEAKLLCLPVRGIEQVFYRVTCPAILERTRLLQRRMGLEPLPAFDTPLADNEYAAPSTNSPGQTLRLEEFQLTSNNASKTSEIAKAIAVLFRINTDSFKTRFLIVSDLFFGHLCRTALPYRMRNALDTVTKTVKGGQLWSEEYLAPETLMLGNVTEAWARAELKDKDETALSYFNTALTKTSYLQVGGMETIGCGWFHVTLHPGGAT